jgi:hypothetical protein
VIDKKMFKKLATHDVQDISELFSLANKCVRAVEGCAWYSQPAPEAGKASKPNLDVAAQGNNEKKKKKTVGGKDKPSEGVPIAVAAVAGGGCGPRGDKCPRQPFGSDEGGQWCPVHNSKCHNIEECREIKNLGERVREQQKQQQRQDSVPPRHREAKQKAVLEDDKDEELEYQDTKRALKAVYGHSDSDSSTDERRKTLHVMYGGS